MLGDFTAFVGTIAPVIGFLLWREHLDRRQQAAALVRADIHAGARRALHGETLLAIDVRSPTVLRQGEVRLSTPRGYESLIGQAALAVLARTPAGYDVDIHCGGGA